MSLLGQPIGHAAAGSIGLPAGGAALAGGSGARVLAAHGAHEPASPPAPLWLQILQEHKASLSQSIAGLLATFEQRVDALAGVLPPAAREALLQQVHVIRGFEQGPVEASQIPLGPLLDIERRQLSALRELEGCLLDTIIKGN